MEKIAVIGLGYVGFPLGISLAKKFDSVIGFDIFERRINTLKQGVDYTNEIDDSEVAASTIFLTNRPEDLADTTFYIVTVPTPIDDTNRPDLRPLYSACEIVGKYLSKGDVVVFESTVYPGVTEDICGPLLVKASGLTVGQDFNLGYSPERINPGDKENPLEKIVKNVSGDSPESLERISAVYSAIITAGIFKTATIKVAEAAKVIENTQRDINIALMNELAIICGRIGVTTTDVIEAASTKWNFIPFYPGLVGGHCIGVDPYYLAALSEEVGHHPEVILAGRRLNDRIANYVANIIVKKLVQRGETLSKARVGIFGITFKENVPDIRNSKVFDLIEELQSFGLDVMVNDAHARSEDVARSGLKLVDIADMKDLDMVVMAVPHRKYMDTPDFLQCLVPNGILIDIKSVFNRSKLPDGIGYWSL